MPSAPGKKARTKAPEARREDLMDAAERLFLKRGVATTTVEHITVGAGVAKGTFYLYFKSKEEVLEALGGRFALRLRADLDRAVAARPARDFRGKLAAWTEAYALGFLQSIRLHDIVFYGSTPHSRGGFVDNPIVDQLSALLQAGADAGAWDPGDCRLRALFLFSGLHGAVDSAHAASTKADLKPLVRTLTRLSFHTLGLKP